MSILRVKNTAHAAIMCSCFLSLFPFFIPITIYILFKAGLLPLPSPLQCWPMNRLQRSFSTSLCFPFFFAKRQIAAVIIIARTRILERLLSAMKAG
ncbi:hypothetical protein ABB37_06641 [Leptomonas pyrrhocoris]|uniref:Uncharacterized protein n=1 Tax=Leptomonas pyrrhocoris TaxID=157538 RepID=A0A0M9FXA2_LEPPY|nr:hypothetical protein ABB37_06641 [Leptomonas pyrrhocoris]KPA77827.1 hypothetical protein ABB37_06641 [Leptomonas pyrrhocoris]|eukprot:XP_015656266.1 hypothetical protein ABB37_06641 [Leptomonas pyrrhocoris]